MPRANNAQSDFKSSLLPDVITAAQKAGEVLAAFFHSAYAHTIQIKSDQSPVTQADVAANALICEHLQKIDSSIPILSEENNIPDFAVRQTWGRYWLIDPLDGTRGFIRRNPEFCVNIALIENQEPVLGVIYSPIEKNTYFSAKNSGAFFRNEKNETHVLRISSFNEKQLRFLCGRFDQNLPLHKTLKQVFADVAITQMNSALKFPHIAKGLADVYVRLGPTSEWDTAAGHCLLKEAGGEVVDFQGKPLQYNAKSSLINPSFIAMGDTSLLHRYLEWINNTRKNT